jgi:uncharacterized protein (DUF302 family)
MQKADYSMTKKLPDTPYEEAVERVTAALKDEGFGVLTEIDVRATMREKLDAEFKPYVILGACNPNLAYRALATDSSVGLLLPCNVVVAAADGGTEVAIARPQAMLEIADVEALRSIAYEAEERLKRVLQRV